MGELIFKTSPLLFLCTCILIVVRALLPIVSLFLLKEVIDLVTNPEKTNFNNVLLALILFSLVQLINAILNEVNIYILSIYNQKLTNFMSEKVLKKAIIIPYSYYENPDYNDSLHLAQKQAFYKTGELLNSFCSLFLNLISTIGIIGLLSSFEWFYTLLILGATLPVFFMKSYFIKEKYKLQKQISSKERKSNYLQNILTNIEAAKEVRTFGFGTIFINRFLALRDDIFEKRKKLQTKESFFSVFIKIFELTIIVFVFISIAKKTFYGLLSTGVFVVYIQGFNKLQTTVSNFLTSLVNLFSQRLFLSNVFSFLDIPVNNKSSSKKCFEEKISQIVIRNLSFSYPNSNTKALENISFTIDKGKFVAIVGENGSGKSTLVKLLAKLYKIQTGDILFNSTSVKDINEESYRKKTTFLFQNYQRYFLDVSENITLGAKKDNTKLKKAAKYSNAEEFISKLKKGFDTLLGLSFFRGTQISGGQWQKLGIARLFYRNSELLVFDEPTSAIDANAEYRILKNLKENQNLKQNIVVFVTHRLYNLKIADKIYVMNKGRIVEQGTFEDLLAKKGLFTEMYNRQIWE